MAITEFLAFNESTIAFALLNASRPAALRTTFI
nr:MAG TPA: hypothetical protein [Caudoviricetes sp.]